MVGALFKDLVSQLQAGLLQARVTSSPANDDLCPIPPVWDLAVRQRLRALPYPDPYLAIVAQPIAEAVTTWQSTLDAPNSLVLLGSPVDDTAAVLAAVLNPERTSELTEGLHILRPLPWSLRPADSSSIKAQLIQTLTALKEAEDEDGEDDPEDLSRRQRVIVLPPLEQCFLRCIGGWQGIEWLRDTVNAQRNYFWVIPSNTWAWAFLNRVCQVEAYLNQTVALPRLDRDQLCAWLTPLATALAPADGQELAAERSEELSWGTFAELCGGMPEVARALWLRSLRIQTADQPDRPQPLDNDEPLPVPLHQVQPILPSLPSLAAADHYVIHALMLHGVMARSHLALSLGQPESIVQVQVQMLRQAGVLRLSRAGLAIHPAYYPRLYTELSTNNFLTEEELS